MSLCSSPRTARSHASSFIQSIDVKTLHYQPSANVTFGLRCPPMWKLEQAERLNGTQALCCLLLGDAAQTCSRRDPLGALRWGGGAVRPVPLHGPMKCWPGSPLLVQAVLCTLFPADTHMYTLSSVPVHDTSAGRGGGSSGGPRHKKSGAYYGT